MIQLICIVVFFAIPSFLEMHPLPKGVYYILMFVTSLITLGDLAKWTWFLNKTNDLDKGSKETVVPFIQDLQLTLEVYMIAIISGNLLLPLPLLALILGNTLLNEELFTNVLLLKIPG